MRSLCGKEVSHEPEEVCGPTLALASARACPGERLEHQRDRTACGVSRSTVQAFCRDPQHETTAAMWERLARALGVSFAEMYERVSANKVHTREHE
jgi:Helix-turn-helix